MIYDQIAVCTENSKETIKALEILGAKNWITDIVESEGKIKGKPFTNKLKLSFNYEMGLYEFEVLEILEGDSFQSGLIKPGISHFGIHVDNADKKAMQLEAEGFRNIGYMRTKSHSSAKNLYYYIFMTHPALGIFVKIIERLPGTKSSTYSASIHYLDVVHRAKQLRDTKVADYGESRYQPTNPMFDEMMCYSDIHRKFIRLMNHYQNPSKPLHHETIKETYTDMLNYCVLAIQMLEQHEKKVKQ